MKKYNKFHRLNNIRYTHDIENLLTIRKKYSGIDSCKLTLAFLSHFLSSSFANFFAIRVGYLPKTHLKGLIRLHHQVYIFFKSFSPFISIKSGSKWNVVYFLGLWMK